MITTKTEIENYLLTNIDTSFDTQVALWIKAIETYINTLANRKVVAEDTENTYRYTGSGAETVFIDDFLTISEVKVNGSVVDNTSYVALPFNEGYVNKLKYAGGGIWSRINEGDIEITGRRGMFDKNSVPEDLRFSATVLVAGIIQSSSNENKEIQSETVGRYTVSYKTDTQKMDYRNAIEIIKSYRRYSI